MVLALSGIGDALLFTPALRLMRRARPDARIDVLAMFRGVQEMYVRNPHVNNAYYFDFLSEGFFQALKFVGMLRGSYDATINVYPSNRMEYNILNFLVGAKKRAGVRYLRMDGRNLGFLNNVTVEEDDGLHNVRQNIKLCEKLVDARFGEEPDLEFPLKDSDRNVARAYVEAIHAAATDTIVGFHAGGSVLKNHIHKRWEPEKFSALGKDLIEKHNARILIFGGPEEEPLKKQIGAAIGSSRVHSVDTPDLGQTAAIIERCNVFVSNDSSLMHVASAMKRGVVLVTGPINPTYTKPWNTRHRVVSLGLECSPCFVHSPKPLTCTRTDVQFKCLRELSVEAVYRAVLDLMRN